MGSYKSSQEAIKKFRRIVHQYRDAILLRVERDLLEAVDVYVDFQTDQRPSLEISHVQIQSAIRSLAQDDDDFAECVSRYGLFSWTARELLVDYVNTQLKVSRLAQAVSERDYQLFLRRRTFTTRFYGKIEAVLVESLIFNTRYLWWRKIG